MTKIIGLTGGIGSGKTTVANLFRLHGIPVYIADDKAKEILERPEVAKTIAGIFGSDMLDGQQVNRAKLASVVFGNPKKLEQLNAIIHPVVKKDFADWVESHSQHPIVMKEAAILFESGSHADCDAVITVTAPLELRIGRVMQRDAVSRESVLKRIDNQWDDAKKIALSDFVIENIDLDNTKEQVKKTLKKLHNI